MARMCPRRAPCNSARGANLGGIDFRLRTVPVYHIRGKLSGYDPSGPPASVLVAPCPTPDGAAEYGAKIQSDGRFDVSGVTAGAYCLDLAQGGESRTLYAHDSVSVTDRNLDGIALKGMAAFTVPGVVRLEGPPADIDNAAVMIFPISGGSGNSALVEDGKFALEGCVPGPSQLRVLASACRPSVCEIDALRRPGRLRRRRILSAGHRAIDRGPG